VKADERRQNSPEALMPDIGKTVDGVISATTIDSEDV
jgi:hypothetical protein